MKALISLAALLSGCGSSALVQTTLTGYNVFCATETQVVYVQSNTQLAPLLDKNGRPVACSQSNRF